MYTAWSRLAVLCALLTCVKSVRRPPMSASNFVRASSRVSGGRSSSPVDHLHPSWIYGVEAQSSVDEFTEDDARNIENILSLADLDHSLFGTLLRSGRLPELLKTSFDEINVDTLITRLSSDAAFRQRMLVLFGEHRAAMRSTASNASTPEAGTRSTGTSGRTTYAECKIDYAGFVEPITNRIINLIRDALCNNFPAPELCRILIDPAENLTMPAWGRRMIDAMGKIPTGIREGKFHWIGAHDMCFDTYVNYTYNVTQARQFDGLYCRLDLTPMPANFTMPIPLLQLGVCVPNTCSNEDVMYYIMHDNTFLSVLLRLIRVNITKVYCGQELDKATDIPYQTAVGIIATLFIIIVIATVYDSCFRKRVIRKMIIGLVPAEQHAQNNVYVVPTTATTDNHYTDPSNKVTQPSCKASGLLQKPCIRSRLELAVVGFSAYTNMHKIFTTESKPDQLPVLDGVRYLTYAWLLYGQTYLMGPIYSETFVASNIIYAMEHLPKNFMFQMVINFHLNSDTFLLISGVLVVYWFLKRFEANNKHLSVKMIIGYFLHKYWRLMPAMMLTLMFHTCLYRYFAEGPLFPSDVGDADNCRDNWWVNLLMVHNLVRTSHMCQTWLLFIPMLFQLHIAVIVILVPLAIRPKFGYMVLVVMYVAHIICTAILSDHYRREDPAGLAMGYFFAPWCRAGAYFIGMALGIVLYKTKNNAPKINVWVNLLLWLIALVIIGTVSFASYSEFKDGGERWTVEGHIAYDTLARSAWAIALGWIVYSCTTGQGGVIGALLSWRFFLPLSRLVYVSILTHTMMLFKYIYTNRILLFVDDYHIQYLVLGHSIFTMLMGLFFGLLWHYPVSLGIERAVSCQSKLAWMKHGRHPRKKIALIEAAMTEVAAIHENHDVGVSNKESEVMAHVNHAFVDGDKPLVVASAPAVDDKNSISSSSSSSDNDHDSIEMKF